MRNFKKLKTINDYKVLDSPIKMPYIGTPHVEGDSLMILRMLVRPKYGEWYIPEELHFLKKVILGFAAYDRFHTGIKDSWCYVTVRHGIIQSKTNDEWHFDGSSFRTDIIPERNYVWVSNNPTEYKTGKLKIPVDFDPLKHNLFIFAAKQLENNPVLKTKADQWYLLSPFCLHRRPIINKPTIRTFYRICFTDIEGRDINNTENPLLPTPAYGRNPVKTFRNELKDYYSDFTKKSI